MSRAVLFCLGLVFAIPAGFMTLAVGTLIEPAARELVTELGLAGADALLSDLWHGGPAAFDAAGVLVGLWALSAALLILPPAFVALVGEIAGFRSFALVHGFGTGLFTAALPGSAGIGSVGAGRDARRRRASRRSFPHRRRRRPHLLARRRPQRRDPLTLIPFPGRMKR